MSAYDDYMDAVQRIKDSSTAVDAEYKRVSDAAATLCDVNQTLVYNPDMSVVRNRGGEVIGYNYKYTTPTQPNPTSIDINSNNDSGTYGAERNRSSTYAGGVVTDPQSTDKIRGAGFVAGVINAAWAATSVLSRLGKKLASGAADALEAVGLRFGVQFGPLSVDADAAAAVRALFKVDDENKTWMYLDEDIIGAMAIVARDEQFFASGEPHYEPTDIPALIEAIPQISSVPFKPVQFVRYKSNGDVNYYTFYNNGCTSYWLVNKDSLVPPFTTSYELVVVSDTSGNRVVYHYKDDYYDRDYTLNLNNSYTYNNKTVYYYYARISWSVDNRYPLEIENDLSDCVPCLPYMTRVQLEANIGPIAWILQYTYTEVAPIPGVSDQPGATIPVDAITGADPHVVAQNLATNYPDVMGTPIQIVVMDDSCNEKTINYYPVSIPYAPTGVNVVAPVTGTVQLNPEFNPNVELPDVDMSRYTTDVTLQLDGSGAGEGVVSTDPATGQPQTNLNRTPNTGSGNAADAVLPETGVSSMWNVYNPSSSQLTAFGSWLWTGNIIEQIKRLLDNPMDAVIGVHAVYGAPSVGGSAPIIVGNLSSNVTANWVNKQYTTVDCGSVLLTEYFGNVLDYPPYTEISLFLPFIGIIPLDVNDVMRAEISVKYNIDVFTGACIAMISVIRDSVGGVLYQFAGNCAIAYPVSGQSYASIFSSMISISIGVAGAIATSGATALHAASTVARGLATAERQVQHSGSFAGNAGAMGPKKPYLIISRPQENLALNFELYDGYGANEFTRIGDLTGYIKCKEVHLTVPGAYADELAEIESLLRSGVILS